MKIPSYPSNLTQIIIAFRVAKTTPTKIGQFVTLWKRSAPGEKIAPFDLCDGLDFVIISVSNGTQSGQFILDQDILLNKGIMSRGGKGGKKAIRVYPPWSHPSAAEAIHTQTWQLRYFLPLKEDGTALSSDRVRELLIAQGANLASGSTFF